MYKYLSFSISIAVISWLVGIMLTALLKKTRFYNKQLAKLNFFRSEQANRIIGLGVFKWIVTNTFFRFFNDKIKLKGRTSRPDFDALRREMTSAEIGHLSAFAFVVIVAAVKLFQSQYLFALVIMLVNILMNLYPSLLQQQNKRRIDRLLKR